MTSREVPRLLPRLRVTPKFRWLRALAIDFGLVTAVMAGYFVLRGMAPNRPDFALDVSRQLIAFERAIGVFWEPEVQSASIRYEWLKEAANFIYAYGHFPVLVAVAGWLWVRGRPSFLDLRNTIVVSMAIGLVMYYLLPAAPPRLLEAHGIDLGFVDTIFGGGTAVEYAQPDIILNEYAAIPSFHFGWIALASAAIWVNTKSLPARTLALALTVIMSWAIVATGNHFFVDMVIGGAVVLAAWALAIRWRASRWLRW